MPSQPHAALGQLPLFDTDLPLAPPHGSVATAPTLVAAPGAPAASTPPTTPGAAVASPPTARSTPPAPAATPPWRHPRTEREMRLGEVWVGYALRRARRRSIGFSVGPDGLSVAAPRWVGVGEIEQALASKAGWIVRKLQEQQDRARRLAAARIDWGDGATLPFLGQPLVLVLDSRCSGVMLDAASDTAQMVIRDVPHTCLRVGLPPQAAPEQVRDAVQGWLQRQAMRIFAQRAEHFARQIGVRVTRLKLSSAQTRWGSASADGTVRLNWRLVHFAMPTIDYVVAHELAHLRHMDHSPRFWDVVRSVVPDVDAARGALRDEVLPSLD
jgi:predicted metal-dependent hydrolase